MTEAEKDRVFEAFAGVDEAMAKLYAEMLQSLEYRDRKLVGDWLQRARAIVNDVAVEDLWEETKPCSKASCTG